MNLLKKYPKLSGLLGVVAAAAAAYYGVPPSVSGPVLCTLGLGPC